MPSVHRRDARRADDSEVETLLGSGGELTATQGGEAKRFVLAMALVLLAFGGCLLVLVAPVTDRVLGNPERDAMLAAWEAARKAARDEEDAGVSNELHFHANTGSPLPLMERLKRHYNVAGHSRHHPQKYPQLDGPRTGQQKRRMQSDGGSISLTEANTEQLEVFVDTGSFYKSSGEANPEDNNPDAIPYSTCFEVGGWFRWNFPEGTSPPCANPTVPASTTHSSYVAGNQLPCGSGIGSLYDRNSNPTGNLCNRNQDSSSQNCWGICVKEDVLNIVTVQPGDPDYISECDETNGDGSKKYPGLCNQREWMEYQLTRVTTEAESYLRARVKTASLRLTRSTGIYNHIYEQAGIPSAVQCGRDALLMYRLPVKDSYCDAAGFPGDVIFFPLMAQYTPNIGGWGGDAGTDQYGRPLVLVMGWSAPTTPAARLQYQTTDQSRAIILHELVHGLGFSVYNFRERKDADGNPSSMVEERTVTDDSLPVWYVTSARTLTVARAFFGCETLTGLPLMGENQLGSGSRGSQ